MYYAHQLRNLSKVSGLGGTRAKNIKKNTKKHKASILKKLTREHFMTHNHIFIAFLFNLFPHLGHSVTLDKSILHPGQ